MYRYETDTRFALGPSASKLSSCGPDSTAGTLRNYLLSGNPQGIPELLRSLPNLDAFQSTLADITGLDPLDPLISEAYWIGNDLLTKGSGQDAYDLLISHYQRHNIFSGFLTELKNRPPKQLVLNHAFQVTWVGVADAGGNVSRALGSVNNCLIRGGVVKKTAPGAVEASVLRLAVDSAGKYRLKHVDETVKFDPDLTPDLKPGDLIAVHWGAVAMALNSRQRQNLEVWTGHAINQL